MPRPFLNHVTSLLQILILSNALDGQVQLLSDLQVYGEGLEHKIKYVTKIHVLMGLKLIDLKFYFSRTDN